MRTGRFLILPLLAVMACNGGDPYPVPWPTGQIRVTTHTSGALLDGAYTIASCEEESEAPCRALPMTDGDTVYFRRDSTQWLDIRLGDVAANCSVPGGSTRVVHGGTLSVDIHFEVVCSDSGSTAASGPATMRVIVRASGDSVDHDFRLDVCATEALCFSQAVTDGQTLDLPRASRMAYQLSLLDVAGNCVVAGGATRRVLPTAAALVAVTFDVQCSRPPIPLPATLIQVAVSVGSTGQDVDGVYTVSICDEQADVCPSRPLLDGQRVVVTVDRRGMYGVRIGDVAPNCAVAGGAARLIPRTADSVNVNYAVTCTARTGAATLSPSHVRTP